MHTMTLEQLRTTTRAGGVIGVTLKGQGSGFLMEITTLNGQGIILSKARSSEPRRFGSTNSALIVLRDIGIAVAQLDATNWNPDQKYITQSREKRAQAMRTAHEAVAYNQWLAGEIQTSIDDSRPSISHDEVMDEMDANISAMPLVKRKRS